MKQRIEAVLTGSRADYGILRPVCRAISEDTRLHLSLLATGMHFMADRGSTVEEIIADDHPDLVCFRAAIPHGLDGKEMSDFLGVLLLLLANHFDNHRPDVLLVLGDHTEMLAGALVAAHMQVPVAHLHGGEQSGGIDEPVRHCISRLAHYHLTASSGSRRRLIRMGEDPERIHIVGAPGLDTVVHTPVLPAEEVSERLGAPAVAGCILVILHPVTTAWQAAAEQMRATLAAACAYGRPVIVVHPNNDAGSAPMVEVIRAFEQQGRLRSVATLPHSLYINLMHQAAVLVGNSSSGIIEAPSLGLPVVNVGSRQDGRERAGNVLDVPAEHEAIKAAIGRALFDESFLAGARAAVNPYGDGQASARISRLLAEIDLAPAILQKKLVMA